MIGGRMIGIVQEMIGERREERTTQEAMEGTV